MKKALSILMALTFILVLMVPVSAAEGLTISPRWSNTVIVAPDISAGSGVYTVDIVGASGVDKISCTMVLYEKGWFGSYSEVSRYSSTVNEVGYTFTKPYNFTSGKTYKLDVSATVYRYGTAETINVSTEKAV